MENEIRFYLKALLKAMEAVTDASDSELDEGAANTQPFKPSYIVTAVKLPTGAIEIAVNDKNIKEKIEYILEAYDEEMRHKRDNSVVMQNVMIV